MLDIPQPSQDFFHTRQAAAVLKHAILRNYLTPWAAKVGVSSAGKRVAIADCYAGAGRYADGSPGSPEIIAQLAAAPGLRNRRIGAFFMEPDPSNYEQLNQVLTEVGGGIGWRAWLGRVEDHLDELLLQTRDVPLFLFLDPFGHGLSLDRIAGVLQSRQRAPATEALIRIDSRAVWRTRGALHAEPYAAREAQLKRLDDTAGGSWWRDEDAPSLEGEGYLEWFMTSLLRRACGRTGYAGYSVAVRRQVGQLPVYYLLFLTRHRDGMTTFNESLSSATAAWRRRTLELSVQGSLFDDPDLVAAQFDAEEAQAKQEWHDRLRANVLELLAEMPSFTVFQQFERVFAGTIGLARSTHLRAVLKELHQQGLTASNSVGKDLYAKQVIRA